MYDDNEAFNFIFLNTAPTEELKLDVFFEDNSIKFKHDVVNTVFLDTQVDYDLTYELDDRMRLIYLISNNEFTFQQECFTAT